MARTTRHNNADKIADLLDRFERSKDDMIRIIATEVQEFALDNFRKQGFVDKTLDPWEKRAKPVPRDQGRNILVDSGALQNSIQIIDQRWPHAVVGTKGVAYGAIHNEGGSIRVLITQRMRRFFWAKYYETGMEPYKFMALTRKTYFDIDIPQRKFLGHSETLNDRIHLALRRFVRDQIKRT